MTTPLSTSIRPNASVARDRSAHPWTARRQWLVTALLAAAASAALPVYAQSVLRVTTIPEEVATEQVRKFTPIAKYLEGKLGMKVEFTPVTDYPAAVEALVNLSLIHI